MSIEMHGGTATVDTGWESGSPHAFNLRLCSLLERMITGRSAEAWLSGGHGPLPRGRMAVIVLPSWRWVRPAIDMGRKDRDEAGGSSLLMPVRLHWMDGPVMVVPLAAGEEFAEADAPWTGAGLGHTGSGSTTVRAVRSHAAAAGVAGGGIMPPSLHCAVAMSRTEAVAMLTRLAEDRRSARWDALSQLDSKIRWSLGRAHAAVAIEVAGADGADTAKWLLDPTSLDSLANRMLLGDDADDAVGRSPFAARLLDQCIDKPAAFARVDPAKYIADRVRSEAESAIRRHVGDPHIGRKVRALAEELGIADPEALLEAYRVRYPGDRLAQRRLMAAMSVSQAAEAGAVSIDGVNCERAGLADADFSDELIDGIDRDRAEQARIAERLAKAAAAAAAAAARDSA